jgi:hypothetical protein
MLFYPGEGFTSDLDKLMGSIKQAHGEIKPTPKFVPQPVVCGNSTTGPPCIPAPVYAGARASKALDDAVFSAAELLGSSEAPNRRKVILLISDGANEPKLNKHDYDAVKAKLLAENISVFSLAAGSDADKRKFRRMEAYSRASGEIFISPQKAEEWSRVIRVLQNKLGINTPWLTCPLGITGMQIIIGWNCTSKARDLPCRRAKAITTALLAEQPGGSWAMPSLDL